MKPNFLIIILSVFFISSSFSAIAQPGKGPAGPPPIPNAKQIKEMVNKLSKELTLNAEQEEKALTIYNDHFALVKSKTQSKTKLSKNEMDSLKLTFENKIRAILTPSQVKKYNEFLKKNSGNSGSR